MKIDHEKKLVIVEESWIEGLPDLHPHYQYYADQAGYKVQTPEGKPLRWVRLVSLLYDVDSDN